MGNLLPEKMGVFLQTLRLQSIGELKRLFTGNDLLNRGFTIRGRGRMEISLRKNAREAKFNSGKSLDMRTAMPSVSGRHAYFACEYPDICVTSLAEARFMPGRRFAMAGKAVPLCGLLPFKFKASNSVIIPPACLLSHASLFQVDEHRLESTNRLGAFILI